MLPFLAGGIVAFSKSFEGLTFTREVLAAVFIGEVSILLIIVHFDINVIFNFRLNFGMMNVLLHLILEKDLLMNLLLLYTVLTVLGLLLLLPLHYQNLGL